MKSSFMLPVPRIIGMFYFTTFLLSFSPSFVLSANPGLAGLVVGERRHGGDLIGGGSSSWDDRSSWDNTTSYITRTNHFSGYTTQTTRYNPVPERDQKWSAVEEVPGGWDPAGGGWSAGGWSARVPEVSNMNIDNRDSTTSYTTRTKQSSGYTTQTTRYNPVPGAWAPAGGWSAGVPEVSSMNIDNTLSPQTYPQFNTFPPPPPPPPHTYPQVYPPANFVPPPPPHTYPQTHPQGYPQFSIVPPPPPPPAYMRDKFLSYSFNHIEDFCKRLVSIPIDEQILIIFFCEKVEPLRVFFDDSFDDELIFYLRQNSLLTAIRSEAGIWGWNPDGDLERCILSIFPDNVPDTENIFFPVVQKFFEIYHPDQKCQTHFDDQRRYDQHQQQEHQEQENNGVPSDHVAPDVDPYSEEGKQERIARIQAGKHIIPVVTEEFFRSLPSQIQDELMETITEKEQQEDLVLDVVNDLHKYYQQWASVGRNFLIEHGFEEEPWDHPLYGLKNVLSFTWAPPSTSSSPSTTRAGTTEVEVGTTGVVSGNASRSNRPYASVQADKEAAKLEDLLLRSVQEEYNSWDDLQYVDKGWDSLAHVEEGGAQGSVVEEAHDPSTPFGNPTDEFLKMLKKTPEDLSHFTKRELLLGEDEEWRYKKDTKTSYKEDKLQCCSHGMAWHGSPHGMAWHDLRRSRYVCVVAVCSH